MARLFGSVVLFGLMFLCTNSLHAAPAAFSPQGATETITFTTLHTKDTIIDLDENDKVTGFAISGSAELNEPWSLVRVVLADERGVERLVYEAYPALSGEGELDFSQSCEETCAMGSVSTSKLRIQVLAASLSLKFIHLERKSDRTYNDTHDLHKSLKIQQDAFKIQNLNQKRRGSWVAGNTSISRLSYSEKRKMFHGLDGTPLFGLPNLQGFEYYKGGVFEIASDDPVEPGRSMLPNAWDWRNRHGRNWTSPVKDQKQCGSCWSFAVTGTIELLVNLYYNQKIDLDLAEQDGLSCSGGGSCNGGLPGSMLSYLMNTPLVNEECFPYSATDLSCSKKCNAPTERVTISGRKSFSGGTETLKRMIAEGGAVSGGLNSMAHAMNLIGWEDGGTNTTWIFKNSWGTDHGEQGYAKISTSINNFRWTWGITGTPKTAKNYWSRCEDLDNDNYCNWGIRAQKPETCLLSCKPEKDCDDSDASLGPFDSNMNCKSI